MLSRTTGSLLRSKYVWHQSTNQSSINCFCSTNKSKEEQTDNICIGINGNKEKFINALNKIPTRILTEMLKKNGIRASNRSPRGNYNRSVLLRKICRLSLKHQDYNDNDSTQSINTRFGKTQIDFYSNSLFQSTVSKFKALNEYYNSNKHKMSENHAFYHTLCRLIDELNILMETDINIDRISTNDNNDNDMNEIKKDLLYELIPFDNDKKQSLLVEVVVAFIKFNKLQRFTMFDHIQYISNLCKVNRLLDEFLLHYNINNVHPSRNKVIDTHRRDKDYDDDYDDHHDFSDDEHEYNDEYSDELMDMPQFEIKDENGKNVSFEIENIEKIKNKTDKHTLPSNMSEEELEKMYEKRLKNIHFLDLKKYGIFGMDETVYCSLKKSLLSRCFYPSEKLKFLNSLNRGIIFYGPSGTGKTMLAKNLSDMLLISDCDKYVSIVNGPEIEDVYVGQTEKNIRSLFEKAKKDYELHGIYSPIHLIIFDEIDSIAKKRDNQSHSKVYDRSVQQLLCCLDGASKLQNILVCATTNRLQDIDSALLRPGRFGHHIYCSLPDDQQRLELLKSDPEFVGNIDHQWFVELTHALSHSDIIAIINQSKINAIQRLIGCEMDKITDDIDQTINIKEIQSEIENNLNVNANDVHNALDQIRINQVNRKYNDSPNQQYHDTLYQF